MNGVAELRMALDPVVFARACGLEPDPWQEDLLRSESPRALMACSRQSGKSTMAAVIALRRALYFPGSLVLVLAPALRQSQELFNKVKSFYGQLENPVPSSYETQLTLSLAKGSRIISLPGNERNVRGYSGVDLLIVDEAARVEDELYLSTRPMLATSGGKLMMMSTPWGRRGVFYEEWEKGIGWERYAITAEEAQSLRSCPQGQSSAWFGDGRQAWDMSITRTKTPAKISS